jgi:hypothetical protein
MTRTKPTAPRKKKPTAVRGHLKNGPSKLTFKKSDWTIIPIAIMVITCLCLVTLKAYALTYILSPSFYTALWFPPLPALFVAVFGVGYIYKTLQGKPIGRLARVIAGTLLAVFVIFMVIMGAIVGGKGHLCSVFSGVPTDCSLMSVGLLYTLFANPVSLTLLSGLAVVGVAALLIKSPSAT